MTRITFATLLCLLLCCGTLWAKRPVNRHATKETKALYARLRQAYGRQCLTGAMAEVNWNHINADKVEEMTGKRTDINYYDFIHLPYSPASWINYDDISPVLSWHEQGGIVAAMWHWNVPISEGSAEMSFYANHKDAPIVFHPSQCLVEGTWERKVFVQDMARVATHLKALQEAGIPVLWRPFHEAKGNYDVYEKGTGAWFWWGTDGPETLKALWVAMYEYFQQQGVNNLIWVFTDIPHHLDKRWYPGDKYVDIVGVDIYDKHDPKALAGTFARLQHLYPNKMCALTECGNVPDMPAQWEAGARWLWVMPWYGQGHASPEWWQRTME